jgi:hypothetical protein
LPCGNDATACIIHGMRVVVSEPAADLIAERGGRLYVWPTCGRCCGSVPYLKSAGAPPGGKEFRRVDVSAGCEVYMPVALARLPEELRVELRRYPRRIESYWDGCAWVV